MATYYVTAGAGGGDGSLATPWLGLGAIIWNAQDEVRAGRVSKGDTLYILGDIPMSASWNVGASGATSDDHTTVRGDYTGNPGSITFSGGNYFLNAARQYFDFIGLMVVGASGYTTLYPAVDNQTYTNCVFDGGKGIRPEAGVDNLLFDGCEIKNSGKVDEAAFIVLAGTASERTHNAITIRSCNIHDCVGSGIQMRLQNDAHANSKLSNIVITDNTISGCTNAGIYIADQKDTATSENLSILRNTISDCGGLSSSASVGGGVIVQGFKPSSAATWGMVDINENVISDVRGDAGGIQLGAAAGQGASSYVRILRNRITTTETNYIDANGIDIDINNDYVEVAGNTISDCRGDTLLPAAQNSGCAVMVLASTNVKVHGNVCDNVRWGVHIGAEGAGQSAVIYNNDFTTCNVGGIYAIADAALASVTIKNNRFSGTGYSVYDLTAVDWSAEDYNSFSGFASGAHQHTLGANSKTDGTYLGLGTWIAGVRAYDDLPLPLAPDIGAVQDRTAPGRRFGVGGGTL